MADFIQEPKIQFALRCQEILAQAEQSEEAQDLYTALVHLDRVVSELEANPDRSGLEEIMLLSYGYRAAIHSRLLEKQTYTESGMQEVYKFSALEDVDTALGVSSDNFMMSEPTLQRGLIDNYQRIAEVAKLVAHSEDNTKDMKLEGLQRAVESYRHALILLGSMATKLGYADTTTAEDIFISLINAGRVTLEASEILKPTDALESALTRMQAVQSQQEALSLMLARTDIYALSETNHIDRNRLIAEISLEIANHSQHIGETLRRFFPEGPSGRADLEWEGWFRIASTVLSDMLSADMLDSLNTLSGIERCNMEYQVAVVNFQLGNLDITRDFANTTLNIADHYIQRIDLNAESLSEEDTKQSLTALEYYRDAAVRLLKYADGNNDEMISAN